MSFSIGQKIEVVCYTKNSTNRTRIPGTIAGVGKKVTVRFANGQFSFSKATDALGNLHGMYDYNGKGVWIIAAGSPMPEMRN